jgi:DNA-directed RNA polymerase subunit RPC12/RpoP
MEGICTKCAAQLESQWSFCPHCGNALTDKTANPAALLETQSAPVEGVFGGLLFGLLAVPILIIVGTLLCLTGLGAILGVPMILAAILAPILGPLVGLGALRGKCPWCAAPVNAISSKQSFDCAACNQRILIRERKFVRGAERPAA